MDTPALDKLESYKTMVTRKKLQESAQNNDEPLNTDEQMKMSKKPSAVENDLAAKVFKTKEEVEKYETIEKKRGLEMSIENYTRILKEAEEELKKLS